MVTRRRRLLSALVATLLLCTFGLVNADETSEVVWIETRSEKHVRVVHQIRCRKTSELHASGEFEKVRGRDHRGSTTDNTQRQSLRERRRLLLDHLRPVQPLSRNVFEDLTFLARGNVVLCRMFVVSKVTFYTAMAVSMGTVGVTMAPFVLCSLIYAALYFVKEIPWWFSRLEYCDDIERSQQVINYIVTTLGTALVAVALMPPLIVCFVAYAVLRIMKQELFRKCKV